MAKHHWKRPSSRLTLAFLISLVLLLGLGTWQIQRLQQKNQQATLIADRLTLNPIALPSADDLKDPAAQSGLDFRRVRVEGVFLHEAERHWWRPSRDGQAGYHILTPLRRQGGQSDGEIVWIDRGWVPPDLKAPSSRQSGEVTGIQNVEGVARLPSPRGYFTPADDAGKNLWYGNDPEALAAGMPTTVVPAIFPLVIEAVSVSPGGHPIPGQTQVILRNPHLGYAITWYGLAVALIAVFTAYHWRKDSL